MLGVIPTANLLTGGGALPWWPDVTTWWLFAGAILLLLTYLIARVVGERAPNIGGRLVSVVMAPSPRVFLLLVSSAGFALAAAAAWYCFNRQPQSIDEMAQLWHARMLLAGHLSIPSARHPEFFSIMNVIDAGGKWYSQFPIGGPLVLAAGLAVGAVWLVNPLLIAFTIRNVYRFLQRTYGELFARGAVLLLLVAPFFIFMGASEQNHVAALALATLAIAALPAWVAAGSRRTAYAQAALVGAAIGGMATVRPLDALAVAAACGVFQLTVVVRAPRRWTELAVQALAGAIPFAVLLWANTRTNGAPLRFGYQVMWGANHGLGFHASPFGAAHTPRRGVMLASLYLMKLDVYLFEWPIAALLAPIVALLVLRRPSRWDALLCGIVWAQVVAYALYWHNGHFLGPRFLYTAVPAFVILAARAPGAVAARAGSVGRTMAYLVLPLAVLAALTGAAGPISVPARVAEYREGQWELKTDIEREVRRAHVTHALVFVHEGWGARLMSQMWAEGVTRPDAEHLLATSDACALEIALQQEAQHPAPDTVGLAARLAAVTSPAMRRQLRPRPALSADPTLRFADEPTLAPACVAEAAVDSAGMSLFPHFLPLDRVERDGRVGGDVVFVRDLGARNELLRGEFGDRTWYRYRPRRSPDDTTVVFVRY